jgi:uncharacterized glyoxalase superfamily protein PhnB
MEPRVSLITLGVRDFERAVRFYRDGLGWPTSAASGEDVAFFRTGGVVFTLYRRQMLVDDMGIEDTGSGFSGITLAHNVASKELVEQVLSEAEAAGATLLKPGEDTFWGGCVGYFQDPEGFVWEVAWNPGFPLADDGSVILP